VWAPRTIRCPRQTRGPSSWSVAGGSGSAHNVRAVLHLECERFSFLLDLFGRRVAGDAAGYASEVATRERRHAPGFVRDFERRQDFGFAHAAGAHRASQGRQRVVAFPLLDRVANRGHTFAAFLVHFEQPFRRSRQVAVKRAQPLVRIAALMQRRGSNHVAAVASDIEPLAELPDRVVYPQFGIRKVDVRAARASQHLRAARQRPVLLLQPLKRFGAAGDDVDIEHNNPGRRTGGNRDVRVRPTRPPRTNLRCIRRRRFEAVNRRGQLRSRPTGEHLQAACGVVESGGELVTRRRLAVLPNLRIHPPATAPRSPRCSRSV
jgi:hypothetical protein